MIIENMPNGNSYTVIGDKVAIFNNCKIKKQEYKVSVKYDKFNEFLAGGDVDKIFPEQSKYVREFIKNGFTPSEQVYSFKKPNINWSDVEKKHYELLNIAISATKDASEYMMSVYNSFDELDVEYKSKHQPLTKADMGSHNHIMGYLKAHTPFFVLSEECDEKYKKMVTEHDSFWLVDPLDGTKEFINKNGEFGILISFIHKGKPIVGVMYFPVTDELYYATSKSAAFKISKYQAAVACLGKSNVMGLREYLSIEEPKNKNLALVTSRSHRTDELDEYLENLFDNGYSIEEHSFGAAVKFAKVLENKAQIYARVCKNGRGPSQWDIAAAHCIIKAAGGEVLNFDTREELTYGHADMKLPSFIIKHPNLNI